jgi:BMFP domain-containing protein YqiC
MHAISAWFRLRETDRKEIINEKEPDMLDMKSLDELTRRLSAALPPGLREIREDTEARFRAVLQSGLEKMDLVTREEFEVQMAVLARTREKLADLEAQLQQLTGE